VLAGSLLYMSRHLHPGIDFRTAVELRALQSVGLAFLFVPINTLVYAGIPPQKNNAVSGIVNLSRNMGGDIGIAFVTTFIARRAQFHQSRLVAHTSNYDQAFTAQLAALVRALGRTGAGAADVTRRALAIVYRQLLGQATTLAYLDALEVLAIATACMVPLLLLTRRPARAAAPAAH